jgi:radical SAM protein with 4Fe4S-binding SPASM domain
MVWLATNQCNANCLHCSSDSHSGSTVDELSTDEIFGLFDQFHNTGVVDVAISGGEPLLRQDIFEIIGYANRLGLPVSVGTNGWNTGVDLVRELSKYQIARFQISLDGFAGSHDRLRRWEGLFDRAVSTINTAVNANLNTNICCTINKYNYRDIDSFVEFVCGLGVKRLNFSRYVPTGRGSDELDLNSDEWFSVISLCSRLRDSYMGKLDIVSHLAQQILLRDELKDMPAFIGCQAGIGQGCVTADGTVWPCVLLPLSLGNIRERTFKEIWQGSDVVRSLRDRSSLKGICSTCDFKARCGGCRAVAYAKSGDYLSEDPRCWMVK